MLRFHRRVNVRYVTAGYLNKQCLFILNFDEKFSYSKYSNVQHGNKRIGATCGLSVRATVFMHYKKFSAVFQPPVGMSLTKLSLAGNNLPQCQFQEGFVKTYPGI